MKWIKTRNKFLNEAKLRDVLLEPQKRAVAAKWGEKYLDYEEIDPTDKINQGKWKLTDEEREQALNLFFRTDMKWVKDTLDSLSDRFVSAMKSSLAIDKIVDKNLKDAYGDGEDFDIRRPRTKHLYYLNESIFYQINISETKSDSKIERTSDGRPVMGEDGRPKKVPKEAGELVVGTNMTNINGFIDSYNSAYPDERVSNFFNSSQIGNILNMLRENFNMGSTNFDIFSDEPLYLLIEHHPARILNMSVSAFYGSCQELYSGSHRERLLGNVFDPNSVPAFLIFDTPFYRNVYGQNEKVSDGIPLCRMMVRHVEDFSIDVDKPRILFDKTYPERIGTFMQEMVESYSGNKKTEDEYLRRYFFLPDIDSNDSLSHPYMDTYDVTSGLTIGKNTKSLYLSSNYDWSKTKISPSAKIKELVIETPDVPENMFTIKIQPEWVKFKFIKIKDLSPFKNILTDSLSFYQCKIESGFVEGLYSMSPNLKKLSLGSVDMTEFKSLDMFEDLEEIELIYSLTKEDNLREIVGKIKKLKKLTISGDLLGDKDNAEFIKELKRNKITVETKGLVL
jgi:hypothetical protein